MPRTTDSQGAFVRAESMFRNWITPDGRPGPTGRGGFPAQAGRYHLIVALNCPWAHRTLIFHRLKGLEPLISVGIVHPQRTEQGWAFNPIPGSTTDELLGAGFIREYYHRAQADYCGRYTVPLLWDKQQQTIVSNESADIIRMFNDAFDWLTDSGVDYYPQPLRAAIDQLNTFVYEHLNNGVYRAGFAKSQWAYEAAYQDVFNALDALEARLARQRYLLGDRLTEADWRLFPTLIRFDAVYHGLFKCNRKRLQDYPALWGYTRELYQQPGIAETVNFDHIKQGYWRKSERNPLGIVPLGPELDLSRPHGRESL
ncbi:glutathione S-transferase family protein [Marinobacterium sp. CAU 1594]|nr:glutathione S-transferase family protein [Marinobacterium arenosum]